MTLRPGELVLFKISKDPLALIIQNARGEEITFPLSAKTAGEMARALLRHREVGGLFDEIAEQQAIQKIQARQSVAAN